MEAEGVAGLVDMDEIKRDARGGGLGATLMRSLVISERAKADLREIWRFSFKEWGVEQADRSLDEFDDVPGMRDSDSGLLQPGHRRFPDQLRVAGRVTEEPTI